MKSGIEKAREDGSAASTLQSASCPFISCTICPTAKHGYSEHNAARITVQHRVAKVDGFTVNWISSSTSHEEGQPVLLLCATTDAPVEDVVAATSTAITITLGRGRTCELWASAPAILPLRPLGGYDEHILRDKLEVEWAASTMKEWGMFVQPNLIERRDIEELRRCVQAEIDSIEHLLQTHQPDICIGKDSFQFAEIASRGHERFDYLLQQQPQSACSNRSKARDFVEYTIVDRVSSILERILDGHVTTSNSKKKDIEHDISVVYSKPGAPHQGWHADGNHQRGATDAGWDVHGWNGQLAPPYALCLFIPLMDLDERTGYTQFWPGSHRNRGLMGFGPVAKLAEATWDGKCNAGDAISYDYRLMHRGMPNISSNVVRPVLQVLFRKSWYVEKRNYGTESIRQKSEQSGEAAAVA